MTTTIPTKDIGEVRDVYRKEVGYVKTFEEINEKYIKSNLRLD